MNKKIAYLLIFSFIFLVGTVQATTLNFTPPTEPNGTAISRNWTEVNITIDESNLDTFKFNWNSTNYSFYDDSLVLALNFNNNSAIGEDSTYVVDISKYGNNGTLEDANTSNADGDTPPQYVSGKFGKALEFDGSDDYVEVPDDESLNPTKYLTVEHWIYPEKFEAGVVQRLVHRYAGIWGTYISVADVMFFLDTTDDGGGWKSVSYTLPTTNTWYHVVAVYDGTSLYLYVNGELKDTEPQSKNIDQPPANTPLSIGRAHLGTQYFQGIIDEFRIYNRTLSEDEIKMHYLSEFQKYNSTQYRFYNNITDLTDGTYTYYGWANDTSGNSNETETRTLTVDTTPPATSASAVDDTGSSYTFNTWTSSSYVNVTLSCSDSGAGCDTTLYCTDTSNSCTPNITYSGTIKIETEGISYIRFRSNDTVGNLETTKSETIKIDTTSPSIQFVSPTTQAGNHSQNYIEANITASDTNLDTIIIYLYNTTGLVQSNSSSNQNLFVNFTNLQDGTYYLNATANDTVGNSNQTETRTVILDTTPPAISNSYPASGTEFAPSAESVTVTFDTDEWASCRYSTTDVSYSSMTEMDNTNSTSHNHTFSVSAGNSYTYYFRCKDDLGNTNTESLAISWSVAEESVGVPSSGGTYHLVRENFNVSETEIIIPVSKNDEKPLSVGITPEKNMTISTHLVKNTCDNIILTLYRENFDLTEGKENMITLGETYIKEDRTLPCEIEFDLCSLNTKKRVKYTIERKIGLGTISQVLMQWIGIDTPKGKIGLKVWEFFVVILIVVTLTYTYKVVSKKKIKFLTRNQTD